MLRRGRMGHQAYGRRRGVVARTRAIQSNRRWIHLGELLSRRIRAGRHDRIGCLNSIGLPRTFSSRSREREPLLAERSNVRATDGWCSRDTKGRSIALAGSNCETPARVWCAEQERTGRHSSRKRACRRMRTAGSVNASAYL